MAEAAKSDVEGLSTSKREDPYKALRSEKEFDRLRIQHEMVKAVMCGKLLLTPTDFSDPGLRVLDSATGNGYWVVDLAKSLAPTATLVGTDIAPQHFLHDVPPNVTLTKHSISDVWPADYQSSFDVVHQRFVLALVPEAVSPDAVQKLFACVKPGGYIQLHEGDMTAIEEGPQHEAATRFLDFMKEAWTGLGYQLAPGPKLTKWLKDAGAVELEEKMMWNKTGAYTTDKTQSKLGVSVLLALLDGMAAFVKCMCAT